MPGKKLDEVQLEQARALAREHPWLPENVHLALFRLAVIHARIAADEEITPKETAAKRMMLAEVQVGLIHALAEATPVCDTCASQLVEDLVKRAVEFANEHMTYPTVNPYNHKGRKPN